MMESWVFKCIVTQLSLAEVHGNLHLSLGKIEEYLDNFGQGQEKVNRSGDLSPDFAGISPANHAGVEKLSTSPTGQ